MNRHHKRRRFAALAACVGSTAAIAVLGTAGSALATVTCRTGGFAMGSSFQGTAQQQVWLQGSSWGTHSSCSVAPTSSTITYTKLGSGPGLEEFGNGTGVLDATQDQVAFNSGSETKDAAGQVLDWYTGSDQAPSPFELGEARVAAGAKNPAEITIPVAQAPVSVLLSLPLNCKIQAGSAVDMNSTTIPQIWEGSNAPSGSDPGGIQPQGGYAIATWGALLTQLGYSKITSGTPTAGQFLEEGGVTGCEQTIKDQVRQISSGTTFAFKSYLSQVNRPVWLGYANDAVTWPGTVVQSDPKTPPAEGTQNNDSGGHLTQDTADTPGSIGYANTADAASAGNGGFTNAATSSTFGVGGSTSPHQILYAEIQNNGLNPEGATYADSLLPASSIANCESTKLLPSDTGFPYSYTDSWYGLLVSDPNISADAGSTDYPICAITYDLVWHHYSNKNLYKQTETAHEVANTVHDLLEYITNQGQIDIQSHDYTRFPTAFAAHVHQAVTPGIGY
jgi:ABC-type phosphate transport system substrate-binding protein